MLPVITPEESARLDAESPVPVSRLMERAGWAVAAAAVGMGIGYGRRVAVLVGPGNNGGDGYVAARQLATRGVAVEVQVLSDPRTEAARWAASSARQAGIVAHPIGSLRPADLVIDALFGGGFRGGVPEPLIPWLEHPAPVLAVDVPTGLDPLDGSVGDRAFTATRTVTFHALRTGHLVGEGPERCGRVTVADIGLEGGDPALRLTEASDAPRPARSRSVHKWSAGSVLVVGGAPGMVGAAVMAGQAALRFGAGAVGVAIPGPSQPVVAGLAPELLSYPIEAVPGDRAFDVMLVGPGLGDGYDELAGRLIRTHPGPVVVDADGLRVVDPGLLGDRSGPTIITPHAGEFARLAGEEPGFEPARRFAEASTAVVVLKGNPTFVSDGSIPWVVTTNGPELATIGTGDVLAGMTAALLARGVEPLAAARSAAYWHGVAGADLLRAGTVTADRLALHVGRLAWEEQE